MPNITRIPPETTVDPAGLSRYFPGGSTGILLLHGWTGNTQELTFLATSLAGAGYTVSLPRLPGHGTNGRDFLQTTWQDWLRKAVDAYLDLAAQTQRVYVAGLSMGGVLTCILASMFPIERIALYAPAITNRNRLIVLTPLVRFFLKRLPAQFDDEEVEPPLRKLAREYWHSQWVLPAAHLYRLQRLAKRRLPLITSDALVVVSKADESVPVSVADLFARKARSGTVRRIDLEESGHVLVNGVEKERVASQTIAWFSEA